MAALIYLLFNAGGAGAHGWAAAMSTDTAFALGVLALVARGAERLRVRLLTVVIIDDLVALLIIATVYSDDVDLVALALAIALFGALIALRYAPAEWRAPTAVLLGVAVWVALFESGIEPVIAGLAVGLDHECLPAAALGARAGDRAHAPVSRAAHAELARSAKIGVTSAVSPNERLQYRLHPWTSFVIVPLFALANAGIHIDRDLLRDALTSPITLGIVFGYIVGKPVGRGCWRLARDAAAPRRPAAVAQLARDLRWRSRGGHRFHGLAPDFEPRVRRPAARGGEARRARRGDPLVARQLGRVPGDRQAPRLRSCPPARRHRGGPPRPL